MNNTIIETREIQVKDEYDLIVCGGGIAGIASALAGARQGIKTMLIEKSAMLGGLATLGLINWYEPLCDGEGRLLTSGIAEELLLLSIKYSYSNLGEQWKERIPGEEGRLHASADFSTEKTMPRYGTNFNPFVFALSLNELLIKEGVELRYDMIASFPVMQGTVCKGVITESAGGRDFFPAKVVVDASGDANIASRAGIPCRVGSNYLTYVGHGCSKPSLEKVLEASDMIALNDNLFWCGSDLNGKGHPENLPLITGIENKERSEFIRQGQSLLFEKIKTKSKNEICLYTLPGMPQLRKTRCIVGMDTFNSEDGIHCETSIGIVGDFRYPGHHYEFPFGIIFNKGFPNLLAAGRIASAEGDGWEITRVIPSAALTGEASGVAASLMVKLKKGVSELNVNELQTILAGNNVKLHFHTF